MVFNVAAATVRVVEAVNGPLVELAVIVVVPAPTAVTKPLASTVATCVLLDVHAQFQGAPRGSSIGGGLGVRLEKMPQTLNCCVSVVCRVGFAG